MPAADVWQATNEFDYQGSPNAYSWYLQIEAENDGAHVDLDVIEFAEARQAAYLPLHNPLVNFVCVTARQIFPDASLPRVKQTTAAGNRVCSPPDGVLPGQCSCVVTLYGDPVNPTRNNRGRDYWTGQCCDDQLNGEWDNAAGYLEEVCVFYNAMTSTFTGAFGNVFRIGIFSRSRAKPPGVPPPPPIVPYFWPLQKVRGRQFVRTQRRRQPQGRCEEICEATVPVAP